MPHALLAKEEVALLVCSWLCACAPLTERPTEAPTVELEPAVPVRVRERSPASREREREPPPLAWHSDPDAALERARREGTEVVVFVRAAWSAESLRLEREAWTDARVRRACRGLVLLRLDVSDTGADSETRMARFSAARVPAVVLLDRRARRIAALEGPSDVHALLALLAKAH